MSEAGTPEIPGAERPDLARQIARVAARLFARYGYEATSIREIVEAAEVSRPTLYCHFGSKEGLAHAVIILPTARLVDALRGRLDAPGDPLDRIEAMARDYFEFASDDPDRARFVYALFFGPPGSCLGAAVSRFVEELNGLLSEAVRRAAEAGRIDPARAGDGTAALRGQIVVHTMDFLYRNRPLGPDLAPRIVRGLVSGYGRPLEAC